MAKQNQNDETTSRAEGSGRWFAAAGRRRERKQDNQRQGQQRDRDRGGSQSGEKPGTRQNPGSSNR